MFAETVYWVIPRVNNLRVLNSLNAIKLRNSLTITARCISRPLAISQTCSCGRSPQCVTNVALKFHSAI